MVDATKFQFTGASVPLVYDEIMVPRLFTPWALLLLNRLGLRRGERLLDVACGPGTVARIAAERLGPKGRVLAIDISPPMLAVAKSKPPIADGAPIEYVESPAAPLAAPDRAFDVVTIQQGLQFFPDPAAALTECRRALDRGGRVGIAVWSSIERCEVFFALRAGLLETVPAELADLLLAPFSWPGAKALETALRAAGFGSIQVEETALPLRFEGGAAQATRLLEGSPLAPGFATLSAEVRAAFADAAKRRLAPLVQGGEVVGEMRSLIGIATA